MSHPNLLCARCFLLALLLSDLNILLQPELVPELLGVDIR